MSPSSSSVMSSKSPISPLNPRPPDCIEVDIVVVVAKEKEGEPGLKSVNRNDEQDSDDPALLRRIGVVPGRIRMRTPRQKYV